MADDPVVAPVEATSIKKKPAGGPPKGSRNHEIHGLYRMKRIIDYDGIDKRSSLSKALRLKEQELIDSLGGDPSPQERVIITDSVKVILYLSTCDTYLSQ